MPILRSRIHSFVNDIWNIHRIRPQAKRPHVVPGKPIMNYYYPSPGVPDCQEPLDYDLLDWYDSIL